MKPTPRRRADAERSIAAILGAARDLFGSGANPSMSEIAQAAGVGRVTLYGHFSSRDALVEAVVAEAIATTDEMLNGLDLDHQAADEALVTLVRTSWSVLSTYRRLRTAAVTELGPQRLRALHARATNHVERLIDRGRDEGVLRTDLPRDWLVATFFAVLHAAADEVNGGHLTADRAPDVLTTTVRSLLLAHSGS